MAMQINSIILGKYTCLWPRRVNTGYMHNDQLDNFEVVNAFKENHFLSTLSIRINYKSTEEINMAFKGCDLWTLCLRERELLTAM